MWFLFLLAIVIFYIIIYQFTKWTSYQYKDEKELFMLVSSSMKTESSTWMESDGSITKTFSDNTTVVVERKKAIIRTSFGRIITLKRSQRKALKSIIETNFPLANSLVSLNNKLKKDS